MTSLVSKIYAQAVRSDKIEVVVTKIVGSVISTGKYSYFYR